MIQDSNGLLQFESLGALSGVRHAFAPASSLGAFDAAREEDRQRVAAAVMPDRSFLVCTRQTHSSRVCVVGADAGDDGEAVDGLLTTEGGVLLHAVSADCPLLFLADRKSRMVGVLHCGWKGVASGIVQQAFELLRTELKASPADLRAGISPGASGCCYEVGPEVLERLGQAGVDVDSCSVPSDRRNGSGHVLLDLKVAIRQLLLKEGVPETSIETADACSICGGSDYHSYRNDGSAAGRMAGVIGLEG